MSLINEALKRAKEAQQPAIAASPPLGNLRPVETGPPSPLKGLVPAIVVAGVVMLSFVVVWQAIHMRRLQHSKSALVSSTKAPKTDSVRPPVAAVAVPTTKVASAPPAKAASAPPAKITSPPPARQALPTQSPPNPIASSPVAPAPARSAVLAPSPTKPVANFATAPKEPAVKPLSLRVQAIVFHPTRPSAVINGRSLFLGDRIGEFRLAGISSQTVTLVKPGKTNVLVLGE